MTSAHYDTAVVVTPAGEGTVRRHIAWRLCAAAGVALMDVVEMTSFGRLGTLVDRYLMGDVREVSDGLQQRSLRAGESHSHNQ